MRRSVKYGLYAAVLAGVVGGTVAWANVDKTVTVRVDGHSQKVHTVAGSVAGVLDDAGYRVHAHDVVAPGVDATVHDGGTIVLDRGRLLHLVIDGKHRDVWVTATTVQGALAELGYTKDVASLPGSRHLALTPTEIDLRSPKRITVVHDGKTQVVTTTDRTVGNLLTDLHVSLGRLDRMNAIWHGTLSAGQKIVVVRIKQGTTTVKTPVPFPTKQQNDATMLAGQTVVATAGKNGLTQTTYALVYINGKLARKTVQKRATLAQPVAKVVKVGTKQPTPPPAPTPPPVPAQAPAPPPPPAAPPVSVTPGSAQAIAQQMVTARGWGSDQFSCLVQMWDRESSWRVDASNPGSGAYGIPQALPGSKMASAGPDWQTNPATQITWGLNYIAGRYGTPCGAWGFWQANGWY